jgi:GGDEF domain-containing protein
LAQHTEAEFERLLSEGIPVNMQQQKMLYVGFDGKATLGDVIRKANLGKPVWLPAVFNLYKCGMIGLPQRAKAAATAADTTQSPMIREAVQEAFAELLRPDTALLSYPLFLHFAEIEFKRALNLRLPFSMVLIKVHKEGQGIVEQLSSEDLKLVAQRLRSSLEAYDHVGHYQTLDIGVLLPHRAAAQAREYINAFISEFDSALAATGNPVKFVWSFGLGCIPEDGIALSAMVNKAEQEKSKPREVASNIF